MESWLGYHESEIIASWGPPQQVTSDGLGGKILIYSSHVNLGQSQGTATTDYLGNTRFKMPRDRGYQRARMFYVNSDGFIYSYKWRGL